jgi:hypothetical protein
MNAGDIALYCALAALMAMGLTCAGALDADAGRTAAILADYPVDGSTLAREQQVATQRRLDTCRGTPTQVLKCWHETK